MAEIVVRFNTDNAAFEENFNLETRLILEKAWERLLLPEPDGKLMDTNGNTVGEITVINEEK